MMCLFAIGEPPTAAELKPDQLARLRRTIFLTPFRIRPGKLTSLVFLTFISIRPGERTAAWNNGQLGKEHYLLSFCLDTKERKSQGCMEWTKNKLFRLKSNKRAALERYLIFAAHFVCFLNVHFHKAEGTKRQCVLSLYDRRDVHWKGTIVICQWVNRWSFILFFLRTVLLFFF